MMMSVSPSSARKHPRQNKYVAFILAILGLNRFERSDRFNIDKYTNVRQNNAGLTEDYWPMYAVAGGVGTILVMDLVTVYLGSQANHRMKRIGFSEIFPYMENLFLKLPFAMLVLWKAVKMIWSLPEGRRIASAFMLVMLLWMIIWSFSAAGVFTSRVDDEKRWWLLVVLSVNLFRTGAVLCNTARYSIWIRGVRSKIGNNECLLCYVDFLFNRVETLVCFFSRNAWFDVIIVEI
ncbi:hypothetical protein MLD38_011433 [Melastoma candidum]|uniref:Uncharacterized protein n=1 Tax=Melastoma candidum TaxID=119954 RepID=A0ACB9RBD6_9MYRT|nr:hypothetical protein MLD38_011433 [Melastoma candidum]